MLAKDTIGDGTEQAPNWASMRVLRDGPGGRVLRASLAIYVDLAGRAVLTEVAIPDEVLRLASTNPQGRPPAPGWVPVAVTQTGLPTGMDRTALSMNVDVYIVSTNDDNR